VSGFRCQGKENRGQRTEETGKKLGGLEARKQGYRWVEPAVFGFIKMERNP